MGDKKAKSVVKDKKPVNKKRRKLIFVIVIIATVIISGILGFYLYKYINKSSDNKISDDKNQKISSLVTEAENLTINGKADQAIALYNQAIAEEKDSDAKNILLSNKAVVYINEKNYDEALSILLEVEKSYKIENTYLLIAMVYGYKENNQKSAEYYQLAIDSMDMSSPTAESDKSYYQKKIEFLRLVE